jgi:GT2 family glycosyltransferase
MMQKLCVVIPNWNGEDFLADCLDSLLAQSLAAHIIVVENGSVDGSRNLLSSKYPQVETLLQPKNLGFAEGVNVGIRRAMELGAKYVALLNNDAVADKDWLKHLVAFLDKHDRAGIVTGKLISRDNNRLDSTGDLYTSWGLPYPRGRDESLSDNYDDQLWVFGASGGGSLYRVKMLEQIGLFDRAFFAYYEDVDISFRAQLAGWKVGYESEAKAYHQICATSSKIGGFATYQTFKNLPMLFWKNVPWALMPKMFWRFKFAYGSFFVSALARGQTWPAVKGVLMTIVLAPRTLALRFAIGRQRSVTISYIRSIITYDLPPNARKLRAFRTKYWRLLGKSKV